MDGERESRSFWDIGEPWRVLRRIENGHRSCDDLMAMIQERADVELRYAKGLRHWASKWDDSLMKGPEYGSVLTAWRTVLQEATAVAKIHEDCRMRLTGDEGPYYNVYKWKSDHFHRGGLDGLQETSEARDAFAAAQKEYAKLLSKVERAKKAYYTVSIAAYRARHFADDEASNPAVSPEARWKLREKADGLVLERERLKQAYLRRVMVCNVTAKERYVQSMTSVFDRWQGLERQRLEHVQSQLHLFLRNLNTHLDTGLSQVCQGIVDHVRRAEPSVDVEEWARKYGTGCPANWPKYEEIDPRANQWDAKLPYQQHTRDMAHATTDEITDEFTTEDSEQDVAHQHAYRWHTQHDRAHQPYRSHQHEVQDISRRHQPRDQWSQQDHHRHPPEHHYSQNEDLSERWLEERHGGRGRSRDEDGRWHRRGAPERGHHEDAYWLHHFPPRHHHHHDDTMHHHNDTLHDHHDTMLHKVDTVHHYDDTTQHRDDTLHHHDTPHHHDINDNGQRTTQDHYHEPIDNLHKGQKSTGGLRVQAEHHRRQSQLSNPHVKETSARYANGHNQDPSSSLYDTLATSQSQESNTHGNYTSSTMLEQPAGGVYHGNYRYHGNSGSDDSLDVHQERSSPEEESYFIQHTVDQSSGTHPRLASTQTLSQAPGQMSRQTVAQEAQQTGTQILAETSQQHSTQTHKQIQAPSQTPQQTWGPTPTQTTPQTYIERRDGTEKKAEVLEQARRTLQPKEGERLVRALYDFKPSTRDEMALKQSEYLVQIGEHLNKGWAYGRKAGAKGHFPASYVQ